MPQMEFADYVPQIVWLILTFLVLYGLMSKLALPRITDILESRQRRLDQDIEMTEKLRDEAKAALAEYDEAITSAKVEAEMIIVKARESIQNEREQRILELNRRMETLVAESDARIHEAMEQAIEGQVEAAIEPARAVTEKLTGLKISEDQARISLEKVRGL